MKQSRITSFSVGRVYNLGNYENLRFDFTVEVPEGQSVTVAFKHMMLLLRAAKPKPPIPAYDYEHAKSQVGDPEAWYKNVKPEKARRRAIREMLKGAKRTIKVYEDWIRLRKAAEKMLDAIGCCRTLNDAKLSWGYNDDDWT